MLSARSINLQSCWDEPGFEQRLSNPRCELPETCCEADGCSVHCASVCDGFIDCDNSTVCSESQCNEFDCRETAPVCFDKSCVGDIHITNDQNSHDFLNQEAPFNWNLEGLLPSTFSGNFACDHSPPELMSDIEPDIHSMGGFFQPASHLSLRSCGFHNQDQNCSFEKTNPVLVAQTRSGQGNLSSSALNNILGLRPTSASYDHQSYLISIHQITGLTSWLASFQWPLRRGFTIEFNTQMTA